MRPNTSEEQQTSMHLPMSLSVMEVPSNKYWLGQRDRGLAKMYLEPQIALINPRRSQQEVLGEAGSMDEYYYAAQCRGAIGKIRIQNIKGSSTQVF